MLQGYADSLRDAPQMRAIAMCEDNTASALEELAKCLNNKDGDSGKNNVRGQLPFWHQECDSAVHEHDSYANAHAAAAAAVAAAAEVVVAGTGEEAEIDAALAAAVAAVLDDSNDGAAAHFRTAAGLGKREQDFARKESGRFDAVLSAAAAAGKFWAQAPAMAATVERVVYRVVPPISQLAGGSHDVLAQSSGMAYLLVRLRPVFMGRAPEASTSNTETENVARPQRAAKLSAEIDSAAGECDLNHDRWATFKLGNALASTRRPAAATGRLLALVVRGLMAHPCAAPFTDPIDEVQYSDYRSEVATADHKGRPVSLQTLLMCCQGDGDCGLPPPSEVRADAAKGAERRQRLRSSGYACASEFLSDLKMLVANCHVYCKSRFPGKLCYCAALSPHMPRAPKISYATLRHFCLLSDSHSRQQLFHSWFVFP